MVDRERETVVVEGDRRSSYGWIVALAVIVLLVILFFAFGGMNMFGGGAETIDNSTPNVQIQQNP